MKPWEKYAPTAQAEADTTTVAIEPEKKPWEKFAPETPKSTGVKNAIEYGLTKSIPFAESNWNPLNLADVVARYLKTSGKDIPKGENPLTYVKPAEKLKEPGTGTEKIIAGAAEIAPEILQSLGGGAAAGALIKGGKALKLGAQALGASAAPGVRGAEEGGVKGAAKEVAGSLAADVATLGAGKALSPLKDVIVSKVLQLTQDMPGAEKRLPDLILSVLKKNTEGKALIKVMGEKDAVHTIKASMAGMGTPEKVPGKIGREQIDRGLDFITNKAEFGPAKRVKIEGMPNLIQEAEAPLMKNPGKLAGQHAKLEALRKEAQESLTKVADAGWLYSDVSDLRRAYGKLAASETDPIKKQYYSSLFDKLNERLAGLPKNNAAGALEEFAGPKYAKEPAYRSTLSAADEKKRLDEAAQGRFLKKLAVYGAGTGLVGVGTKAVIDAVGTKK